jgi:hypothetical protein
MAKFKRIKTVQKIYNLIQKNHEQRLGRYHQTR